MNHHQATQKQQPAPAQRQRIEERKDHLLVSRQKIAEEGQRKAQEDKRHQRIGREHIDIAQRTLPVKKGTVPEIIPEITEEFSVLLKKGEEKKITSTLSLSEELTAPVKKGDTVGRVNFYLNGQEIGSLKVTAKNGSDRLTYGICLVRLLKSLFTL